MSSKSSIDEFMFQTKCLTCLSVGRKMYTLQKYLDIFESIMSTVIVLDLKTYNYNICWECFGFLRNVRRFQKKALKASKLFLNKQLKNLSLSTLCSKSLNETQSYCFTNTPHLDTQTITNIKDETEVINYKSDQDTEHFLEETPADASTTRVKHKKTQSKWAQKHLLQKRKQKYSTFCNTNNIDFNFRRLPLEESEIHKFSDRDDKNSLCKNKSLCSTDNTEDLSKKTLITCQSQGQHFICDICEATISTKQQLTKHITAHYYKYNCKWCKYIGYSKREIKYHVQKHAKLIKCLRCEFICGSSQEFSDHYRDWHETYICHYCGVSFKMRYCIKDHIRKRHSALKCKTCSKEFKRYNSLWLHNKICHSPVQTKAYCNICDKHFVDIYRYKWHLANSVKHKPRKKVKVPCPNCEKVFTKNIYMQDHYNLVHLKIFNYRCEKCDKNFIRNADLLKHIRRVHEGILPPKDKICHRCGRGFTTNKILRNHLRTHATAKKQVD